MAENVLEALQMVVFGIWITWMLCITIKDVIEDTEEWRNNHDRTKQMAESAGSL